jgi:hypothetical protein
MREIICHPNNRKASNTQKVTFQPRKEIKRTKELEKTGEVAINGHNLS